MTGLPPSSSLHRRRLLALLAAGTAGACTPRPGVMSLTPYAAPEGAEIVTIYAATNRANDGGFQNPDYRLRYFRYEISVPRRRQGAGLSFVAPNGTPDPETDYFVTAAEELSEADFLVETHSAHPGPGGETSGIFVHGFNMRHAEALFRAAQMSADADSPLPIVLFSWPSAGKPLDYVNDRQTALFSREALAGLLAKMATRGRVMVFAHSMGGFLTIEALRDMRLRGQDAEMSRLSVILAAPDVDILVFADQMKVIGRLNPPMVVLVSTDDRALRVSSRIAGGRPRLGALPIDMPEVAKVANEAGVTLIDISTVESDPLRHNRYVHLGSIYSRTQEAGSSRGSAEPGTYVLNLLDQALLRPVGARLGP